MLDSDLVSKTRAFVAESLRAQEGSHDWWHVERVWRNAIEIHLVEGGDRLLIELAALLHDIADRKHHGGDEKIGPHRAKEWLLSCGAEPVVADKVAAIISAMGYGGPDGEESLINIEHAIVQDADRLDAMGAIGIGRAFTFGGHFGRQMHDPTCPPNLAMDKASYRGSQSNTLNHFFEKLLHLKDRMATRMGRELAAKRHEFMVSYVREFLREWGGEEDGNNELQRKILERFATMRGGD